MTEIEKKALALWGPGVTAEVNLHNFSILGTAFLEMRERHEAFRQEVSDAVEGYFGAGYIMRNKDTCAYDRFARFIIPKPDPLVEAWIEATGNTVGMEPLNEALAKRGGKIVWED